MIKKIIHKNKLYALIIKETYQKEKGISFFTENDANQQIGYMNHPKNYFIKPHTHQKRETKIFITSEVIILQKGKLRVDFYDTKKKYLFSIILKKNQIIMLVNGGHGFKVLESVKMLEIKQGPFVGNKDKIKFDRIDEKRIKLKKI
ncbi:hypothetical protein N9D06_02995 [Candidatus Pelagibacter sp.]|jgi:hypothetical protein|nr:hypothetical protein [Candidatus Pelagibacter sp.]|tara:strand:- start:34 stop:471 length:438 start_codon:yes stop_codon:yes gene_type:complete